MDDNKYLRQLKTHHIPDFLVPLNSRVEGVQPLGLGSSMIGGRYSLRHAYYHALSVCDSI